MWVYVMLQLLPCLSSLSADASDGKWLTTTTVFFHWGMCYHGFFFAGLIREWFLPNAVPTSSERVGCTSLEIPETPHRGGLLYCHTNLRVIMKRT